MRRFVAALLFAAAIAIAPAKAETVIPFAADPAAPVEIEADRLEVDNGNARAIFIGAVSARQGPLTLKAERMTVFYAPTEGGGRRVVRLEAEDKVELNSARGQAAQGEKAAYEVAKREVILSGPVLLRSGAHVLAGDRLVVDLQKGQSRLEGGSGRVRGLFGASPE